MKSTFSQRENALNFVKFSQRILLKNVLRSAWRNFIYISGPNFRVTEETSGDKTTFCVAS